MQRIGAALLLVVMGVGLSACAVSHDNSGGVSESPRQVSDLGGELVRVGSGWMSVSAGATHTVALKRDGTLWTWGYGKHGELGLEGVVSRNAPTQVGKASDWTTVSSGFFHTVALKRDGSLWAWGWNLHGQLGLGAIAGRDVPTQVGQDRDWAAVSCAANHTLALKRDGSLWAWGWNNCGQLGLGNTAEDVPAATKVAGTGDWATVSAGEKHSLALKRDGSLWAWGWNDHGQLGLGHATDGVAAPVRIGSGSEWGNISSGYCHSLALKRDGSLWAWGDNSAGELGLGDTGSGVADPTRVGSADDWVSVFGGRLRSLALKRDGSLWAWGDNSAGELGLGDTRRRLVPTQIGGTDSWAKVAFSVGRTLGLRRDGTLWMWGENSTMVRH